MNSWLDRGLFAMTWVGCIWIADATIGTGTGRTSFLALMIGAASIALVGLVIQAFSNGAKRNG
jgi:uncharacterized membrane protein YvlD (DUF360 family)